MKILLSKEEKPVIEEIIDFLKTLSEEEQKEMNILIRGYELGIKARGLKNSKEVMLAAM